MQNQRDCVKSDCVKKIQVVPLAYEYEHLLGWVGSVFGRKQFYGNVTPDGGAVDGCWWASRQDSRWVGSAGRRGLAGGLGVPLTITPPSELHQPDEMVTGGMGRKGMEPKVKAWMWRGAAGFLV